MKQYRYLYFDLDRTLWDYDTNASEAIREVYDEFELQSVFGSYENFWTAFDKYNNLLWSQFQTGSLKKEILRVRRFELALLDYKTKDKALASKLNDSFLHISPHKPGLIAGTNDVLEYLKSRNYRMFILTNGFTKIQETKMESAGLNPYFEKMFTTENTRSHKPKKAIFEHALKTVNARKAESLMIGDDLEVDIVGARNFGMDQAYFNPGKTAHNEKVTYEISSLTELKDIL